MSSPRNLFPINFDRRDPGKELPYHADTSELFLEDDKNLKETSRGSECIRQRWLCFDDPELYVYKLFYFFFHAATALFAYLPLYYKKSLLLDHHHIGLLMGIRPFCEFLGAPCLGTFADKFNKYKSTLYSGLLAYIVVYLSMTFVDGVPKDCTVGGSVNISNITDQRLNIILDKGNQRLLTEKRTLTQKDLSQLVTRDPKMVKIRTIHSSRWFYDPQTKTFKRSGLSNDGDASVSKVTRLGDRERSNRYLPLSFLKSNSVSSTSDGVRKTRTIISDRSTIEYDDEQFSNTNRKSVISSPSKIQRDDSAFAEQLMEAKEDGESEFVPFEKSPYDNFIGKGSKADKWLENVPETAGEDAWPLDVYTGETKTHDSPEQKKVREHVFMILLLLTLAAEFIGAPILSLADTATLQSLRKEPYRYGHQRVWASFGFGFMSIAAGSVLHYTVSTKDEVRNCPEKMGDKYRPVFYSCSFFLLLAFLTTFKFRFRQYEGKDTSGCSFFRCLRYFNNVEYGFFVFLAWVAGLAHGLTDSFLFVHLIRLGATPLLLVVTTSVRSVSKVIFFCLSPMIIVKYGYFRVIYAGLLTNVITFFYYSFLESPWMVVPIEFLAGISSSCVWAALVSYVGAPPKIGATLQGILHAVHIGLGRGIGGLFGGMILVRYGFNVLFQSFSLGMLLIVLTVMGLRHWLKQDVDPIWSKLWDYSPVAPYDELTDDD